MKKFCHTRALLYCRNGKCEGLEMGPKWTPPVSFYKTKKKNHQDRPGSFGVLCVCRDRTTDRHLFKVAYEDFSQLFVTIIQVAFK